MLEKIAYIEHFITSLDFREISFKPGIGGSLTYKVTLNGAGNFHDHESAEILVFSRIAEISIIADNKGDEGKTFTLDAEFKIVFGAPHGTEEKLTAEFFDENEWFFVNSAHQIAHQIVSSALQETRFKNVPTLLPRHRIPAVEGATTEQG